MGRGSHSVTNAGTQFSVHSIGPPRHQLAFQSQLNLSSSRNVPGSRSSLSGYTADYTMYNQVTQPASYPRLSISPISSYSTSGYREESTGYVPGPRDGLAGDMADYAMYTQQPGYARRPVLAPPQFPISPTYRIDTSAIPRLEAIARPPGTGYVNDHTRTFPYARVASDRAPPPPYRFATPSRPGVPEFPYQPGPSSGGGPSYEFDSSYAFEGPHPQALNPPSWLSPTPQTPSRHDVNLGRVPTTQPYSSRVGQKKALLIGINYSTHSNPNFKLTSGVRDAYEIAKFLCDHLGFERNNMRILTDDQPQNLPTKDNILAAMYWLVEGAQPGDSLFFYFSGHATQVNDMDGDEPDGLDECICAMDFMGDGQLLANPTTPGIIVDDDIHKIMVNPLPRGCRLTAVLDCCHSGTLLDLPFIYDPRGNLKPYNPNDVRLKASDADVISLSACKDSDRAFDAREGGALRKAFIEYITSSGNRGTYFNIIQSLRAYMHTNHFRQQPQLSSSHRIDIHQPFTISL